MNTCQECGMVVKGMSEYHPYAACLMFKACHDGEVVRASLAAVQEARATPVGHIVDVNKKVSAQSVRDAALDSSRLDYLDKRNARKNEQYGTKYGWQLNENHNRIALEDHAWPGATVREAIDQAMKDVPLKPVSDEVKP